MATGAEQRAVAEGGAGEEGVGSALASAQHVRLGGQQLVGPGRGEFGCGAQITPVVAQVFDVGRVVVLDGIEEAVEPILARGGVYRCVADERHQFLDGRASGVAEGTRGTVDLVQGIFGDAPWTNRERLPDETLKDLIEHFSTQTLSVAKVPEDELGNTYDHLIKKFADDSGHTAAEFHTRRTVVHLMTQLLAPQAGESIYDPTCGTGGMLISALDEVKRSGGEYRTLKPYGQERTPPRDSTRRNHVAFGCSRTPAGRA